MKELDLVEELNKYPETISLFYKNDNYLDDPYCYGSVIEKIFVIFKESEEDEEN